VLDSSSWLPGTTRLPRPRAAPIVRWMFAERLAGHSVARMTRALNDAAIPCPSAVDPRRNPHRTGTAWTLSTAAILANPRYTGRQGWNRQRAGNGRLWGINVSEDRVHQKANAL